MRRGRAVLHWLSSAAAVPPTYDTVGAPLRVWYCSRNNGALLASAVTAVCTLGCVAAAASAPSASCSSTSNSSDDNRDDSEGGGTEHGHFFMEPINAIRRVAAVLRYSTPDQPPAIHRPQPPDGPLPKLAYPVVLVHGFLGYSSLLTNPINKQPVFEYFGELRSLLEGAGHTVVVPVLPRSYKVEKRAKALQVALGLTPVTAEMMTETDTQDGPRQTQKQTPVAQSDKEDVQQAKHDERALPAVASERSEDEGVTVLTNNRIDLASYKGPFHLIAHSMGGLDSRFLITHLQPTSDNRILSLTTIGSPHRGSPIADLIVEQVQKDRTMPIPAPTLTAASATTHDKPLDEVELPTFKIEQIVAFISNTFNLDFRGRSSTPATTNSHRAADRQRRVIVASSPPRASLCLCVGVSGMLDLSTSACADFNRHTPNRSDTHYRSYSGYRPFDAWSVWFLPGKLIEAREGYNDGLVSVKSAQWGTHVGTVALDHLQQVGLGVMHRHIDLYREIVWELYRIEQQDGERQRRRQVERERGRRKQGSGSEQQRRENEAAQRTEASRNKAQQKGSDDASSNKRETGS